MKKLLLLLVPLVSLGQVQVQGAKPTYANPYVQPIKVQVQLNPNNSIQQAGQNFANSMANAVANRANYAAAQAANAQAAVYASDISMKQAVEIAKNPLKGYEYGRYIDPIAKGKFAKSQGFKKAIVTLTMPHPSIFSHQRNWIFRNESEKNIVTELSLWSPFKKKSPWGNKFKVFQTLSVEEYLKFPKNIVGKKNTKGNFIHHKEIKKATVFSNPGYKGTLYIEDDYEYIIQDLYYSEKDGIIFNGDVVIKGDKTEVTFEDLEERRQYLRRLVNQTIAAANLISYK